MNDNAPVFALTSPLERGIILTESPNSGKTLATISASDADFLDKNTQILFSIGEQKIAKVESDRTLRFTRKVI